MRRSQLGLFSKNGRTDRMGGREVPESSPSQCHWFGEMRGPLVERKVGARGHGRRLIESLQLKRQEKEKGAKAGG